LQPEQPRPQAIIFDFDRGCQLSIPTWTPDFGARSILSLSVPAEFKSAPDYASDGRRVLGLVFVG
jgi:hypothetical protein